MINVNDNLVQKLNLGGLSEEQQRETLEKALTIVYTNIGERVGATLNEEQLDKFNAMVQSDPTSDGLVAWLEQNVPNYSQIVDEELDKYVSRVNGLVSQSAGFTQGSA